jgi:hypothetical protein
MWKLYSYKDASGVLKYIYAPSSQESAILGVISEAGGTEGRLRGTFEREEHIIDDGRFTEATHVRDGLQDNKTIIPDDLDTEDIFGDLGNMGATLRNFMKGQGISPGGSIASQAESLLLPAAQAALGFGQGLNPAQSANLNLTNLLRSGNLGGIASQSRNVFNQLANSGGGADNAEGDMEGSFQRPATAGSDLAGGTRNLALGALFERSPFFAAMFGRNAVSQASDRFFENQRAGQGTGGGAANVSRNMSDFMKDQIGRNLFEGSSL